jgi:hypothetical protein
MYIPIKVISLLKKKKTAIIIIKLMRKKNIKYWLNYSPVIYFIILDYNN